MPLLDSGETVGNMGCNKGSRLDSNWGRCISVDSFTGDVAFGM